MRHDQRGQNGAPSIQRHQEMGVYSQLPSHVENRQKFVWRNTTSGDRFVKQAGLMHEMLG